MRPIPKLLSKTKLLRGFRCPKAIYLTVHEPHLDAPITPELQALFDQGNQVGAIARTYFPGGTLIDNVPWDFVGALKKTKELIASGVSIIYEAAFDYAGCYARADIIVLNAETNRWHIYEVKSTTKVKDEHIIDISLQAWIMAKSGLAIADISIMHLNSDCRYPDLSNLFTTEDITDQVRAFYPNVQPQVRDILTCIRQTEVPPIDIGPYCLSPTECGFKNHCWSEKNIPDVSIFNLPGIRDRKWQLYAEGIIDIFDPRLEELTELQLRAIECTRSGITYIDKEYIHAALCEWQFPLIFLDFETINPAIPCYSGCGPFMHVPFQFSVHRLDAWDGKLSHTAFLHTEATDPRETLIPALLSACRTAGSIVAYFGQFEAGRIKEMADYSPADQEALLALIPRIVDPLQIIRHAVYDPKFMGSFSLKSVAPALLGEKHSYEGMDVANGGDAQRAYLELTAASTRPTRKLALEDAMLAYCEKDTFVMVELAKWLKAVYDPLPKNHPHR